MKGMLLVGVGGALGAMMRYGISLLPIRSNFPILTLFTNLLGAIIIGFVVGAFSTDERNNDMLLLLKTGVCGGFTTFSTFSFEALQLFQKHQYGTSFLYIASSVILCILGVAFGSYLSARLHFAG